jgi:hypothetical protein
MRSTSPLSSSISRCVDKASPSGWKIKAGCTTEGKEQVLRARPRAADWSNECRWSDSPGHTSLSKIGSSSHACRDAWIRVIDTPVFEHASFQEKKVCSCLCFKQEVERNLSVTVGSGDIQFNWKTKERKAR